MNKQAEQEENLNAAEVKTPPSNKALLRMLVRMKLQMIANYILDGFAPVAAVTALIIAMMAINANHSGQVQFEMNTARIDSLNANLTAAKSELEKLKSEIAKDKALHEQAGKKQDEQMAKIIQNITLMQVKMKISPTVEEQMRQPASAAAGTTMSNSASTVTALTTAASGAEKTGSQGQILTKAIEKFNEKRTK